MPNVWQRVTSRNRGTKRYKRVTYSINSITIIFDRNKNKSQEEMTKREKKLVKDAAFHAYQKNSTKY